MKRIIHKIMVAAAAAMAAGCAAEDLKEANFSLYQAEGMQVEAGDGCATVTWTAQEGKPLPVEYIVSWTPDSEEVQGGSQSVPGDVTELLIENLVNGCTYTFGVQASYEEGLSMEITTTATPKSTRIAAGDFRAVAGDKLAVLTWTAPETQLNYSYELVIEAARAETETVELEATETRYVAENLSNDTEYTFRLICVYGHGNSEPVTATAKPGDIKAILTDKTTLGQFELAVFDYNEAYFITGTVSKVEWDFGDNSEKLTGESVSHLYTSAGTFSVTVTVTYDNTQTATGTIQVTVNPFAWSTIQNTSYQKASNIVFSRDGQTFYSGTADKKGYGVYAFSTITGEQIWSYTISSAVYGEGPAIGPDGTVYFAGEDDKGNFYALNPDGTLKWEKELGKAVKASPAVTSDGIVYVLADGGVFKAFDAETGKEKWSAQLSGNAGGVAVDNDGTAYISQYDPPYELLSFDASGTKSTVTVIGVQTMSPETLGPDGRIYYGMNGSIGAYDAKVSLAESGWPMRGGNQQGTNSLK